MVAEELAFAIRNQDPFGVDHDCLNPAGHDFIGSCGDVVCCPLRQGGVVVKPPPEMSKAQFREALKRRGFRQVLLWFEDTTGECPDISWDAILHRTGKMARRATLAKIIRERDAEIASRASTKDACQFCAAKHPPDQPHNAQSLYYQMAFNGIVGRSPTWADAIAHCDEPMRKAWEQHLRKLKAWSEPPAGETPVKHHGVV